MQSVLLEFRQRFPKEREQDPGIRLEFFSGHVSYIFSPYTTYIIVLLILVRHRCIMHSYTIGPLSWGFRLQVLFGIDNSQMFRLALTMNSQLH